MIDWTVGFLGGLATGYLLTWPGLFVLFVLGVLFEHNDARGWAVFTGIGALVASFFFFGLTLSDIAFIAIGYVVVGLLWSFWRYKRYLVEQVARIKASGVSEDMKRHRAEQLHPAKNLDTITAWIIIWPFSVISSLTGDLIDLIQTLVQKVFKGVYHRMYVSATADLIKD